MSYFQTAQPNIHNNNKLREPQIEAYNACLRFFRKNTSSRKEAIINLPTGTGKTGLMAIAPFGISKKRVLIITPQTVVRDTVMGSLDSLDHKNFWMFAGIFNKANELPSVVLYDKNVTVGTLEIADIVVLNIHKLQERLESSLLHKVDKDFFDLIIIDEAHHSEAYTWKRTVDYFCNANILKVTGTPFRSDGVKISGETIYKYSLSKAMANGYVKSLEKFEYCPEKMEFTLDGDARIYSLEEIRKLKLKDDEWISRQVALSKNSNLSIVRKSIEFLQKKRRKTNNPHKIVAVACSILHAYQLKELYESEGMETAIVHSDMEKPELEKEFEKIDNHKVQVVINVALLGEGYDHKFLSIAAIFRPFRSDLPYQQFIGRVLRSITPADVRNISPEDNIAQVVCHKELGLEKLWESYKKEIIKKGIILEIRKEKKRFPPKNTKTEDLSDVFESEEHIITSDTFIDTALLEKRKKEEKEELEKIKRIMEELQVTEEMAKSFIQQAKGSQASQKYLRPDLIQADLRKQIDSTIREEIIPTILADFNLELKGFDIYNNKEKIFPIRTVKILRNRLNNGACLAIHFNDTLKRFIGDKRENWEIEDYEAAMNELKNLESFIYEKMEKNFRR